MSRILNGARRRAGSGVFWGWFWACAFVVTATWGALTFVLWLDSVPNLNALSIAALLIACGAGFQSTLSMRKADPDDPL